MAQDVGMLAAKAKLAPATRALLMNAYLNFMDSVMRFWLNAWTEALMPSPNVFNRASVPSDQQPEKPYALDVGKGAPLFDIAAPLIDLHSLYEGGRWDHILSAPEQIHVVLNTTFNFGDIAGDAERRPGSVAERDGGGPNRGLSAPALPRPDTAPPASSTSAGSTSAGSDRVSS